MSRRPDLRLTAAAGQRSGSRLRFWSFVLALAAAWQAVVSLFHVPPFLLPGVIEITRAFAENAGLLVAGLVVTGFEVLVSFAASAALGIALGVVMVNFRLARRAVFPLLVVGQSVPILAAAPLFVVWFGFDLTPKILIALLIAFFPILMGTMLGLRSTDPDILTLARSMGLGPVRRFVKIELPGALPYLFAGLKVAATLVVVGVVVGEFVGSSAGLGYVVLRAAGTINTPLLFAALGMLVVIGLLLSVAVAASERRATPWRLRREPARNSGPFGPMAQFDLPGMGASAIFPGSGRRHGAASGRHRGETALDQVGDFPTMTVRVSSAQAAPGADLVGPMRNGRLPRLAHLIRRHGSNSLAGVA